MSVCSCRLGQAHDRHTGAELAQRGHDEGAIVVGGDEGLAFTPAQHGASARDPLRAAPGLSKAGVPASRDDGMRHLERALLWRRRGLPRRPGQIARIDNAAATQHPIAQVRRDGAAQRMAVPAARSTAAGALAHASNAGRATSRRIRRRAPARARQCSRLSPPIRPAPQTRLRSISTKREASGARASKEANAARLHSASVNTPHRGRRPDESRSSTAHAAQSSLPCTSAVISTLRPAVPLEPPHTFDAGIADAPACQVGRRQRPYQRLHSWMLANLTIAAYFSISLFINVPRSVRGAASVVPTSSSLLRTSGASRVSRSAVCSR